MDVQPVPEAATSSTTPAAAPALERVPDELGADTVIIEGRPVAVRDEYITGRATYQAR